MYYWQWLKNVVRIPHTTGYPSKPDAVVESMLYQDDILFDPGANPSSGFAPRSVAIRQVDGGSSNGCESELSLLSGPDYDFTRYGFSFAPSPKHADILVVTGVITQAMVPVIKAVFSQMTQPKRVLALGSCAIDGWVFKDAPGVVGRLDGIVPVTVAVAGCPPTPGDILRGLMTAVDGQPVPSQEVHP